MKLDNNEQGKPITVKSGERKPFTTTIDTGIIKEFRIACIKNGLAMNEVIEIQMLDYIYKNK